MPKILGGEARGRKKSAWPSNRIGHSALHALRREDISDFYSKSRLLWANETRECGNVE